MSDWESMSNAERKAIRQAMTLSIRMFKRIHGLYMPLTGIVRNDPTHE